MEKIFEMLRLLSRGEENARSRAHLSQRLEVSDRDLRDLVAEARIRGHPVLSSSKGAGYYLPAVGQKGIDEANRFIAEQNSRIKKLKDSTAGAKNYLNRFGGKT